MLVGFSFSNLYLAYQAAYGWINYILTLCIACVYVYSNTINYMISPQHYSILTCQRYEHFLYSSNSYFCMAKPVSHPTTTKSCMQLSTKFILVCINFAESCQSFNLEWNISCDYPPAIISLWSDSQYMSPNRKLSQHMGRGTYKNKIYHYNKLSCWINVVQPIAMELLTLCSYYNCTFGGNIIAEQLQLMSTVYYEGFLPHIL